MLALVLKISSGDFDFSDIDRNERTIEFNSDVLKALVERDAKLVIREIANILQATERKYEFHINC